MRFTGTFVIVVALFVVVLITSNIIAVKPIQLLTLPFEFLGSFLGSPTRRHYHLPDQLHYR